LLKRCFDLIASLFGIVILFPIIIFTFLINMIVQGFPILFYQQRIGENGIPFILIKFRTMSNEKSLSAIHDISRLTKWGRFLRKTSIDELPALFNVIKGDMSLVGPRPLPLKYLNRFDDYQIKRIEVKPGITGLAQINGRNQLSWEKRFEYDVQYTNNNSFLIDLKIIFKTILLVIRGKNISAKGQEIMPEFMGSKNKEE
tara:strand:+ start:683 stop:1282 length:600 start_codon:yes stop_codon:yes gene_type:complete